MLNLAVPDPSFRMGAIVRSISAPSQRGAYTKSSNTPRTNYGLATRD